MPYLNSIQIIGHVGKAPEIATFGSFSVIRFTVAVGRGKYNGKDLGTDWFNVNVSEKATWVLEALGKGDLVYVDGSMKIELKDGKTYVGLRAGKIMKLNKSVKAAEPEPELFTDDGDDSVPF